MTQKRERGSQLPRQYSDLPQQPSPPRGRLIWHTRHIHTSCFLVFFSIWEWCRWEWRNAAERVCRTLHYKPGRGAAGACSRGQTRSTGPEAPRQMAKKAVGRWPESAQTPIIAHAGVLPQRGQSCPAGGLGLFVLAGTGMAARCNASNSLSERAMLKSWHCAANAIMPRITPMMPAKIKISSRSDMVSHLFATVVPASILHVAHWQAL